MTRMKSMIGSVVCASLLMSALPLAAASAAPLGMPAIKRSDSDVTLVGRRGWGPGALFGGIVAGFSSGFACGAGSMTTGCIATCVCDSGAGCSGAGASTRDSGMTFAPIFTGSPTTTSSTGTGSAATASLRFRDRSFFGVYRVLAYPAYHLLQSGTTTHGAQHGYAAKHQRHAARLGDAVENHVLDGCQTVGQVIEAPDLHFIPGARRAA